jgi:hypothetical protein
MVGQGLPDGTDAPSRLKIRRELAAATCRVCLRSTHVSAQWAAHRVIVVAWTRLCTPSDEEDTVHRSIKLNRP